ncbi:hypothetical protein IIY66_00275 [Candidatus Saccharibacteria bacterium]|nr:hypothetical protein [Candidatus Saccharibacteria bacterium]
MGKVRLTHHFDKRFSQRIAKSKRMPQFASQANRYGKRARDIKYGKLRKELLCKERQYGTIAKIYNNNIYWFDGEVAVTVYPLSQKFHGKI